MEIDLDPVRDGQHRITGKTEWCAAASQRHPPREEADNVATKCKQYVTFPCGVEKRAPTCEECSTAIGKTTSKRRNP